MGVGSWESGVGDWEIEDVGAVCCLRSEIRDARHEEGESENPEPETPTVLNPIESPVRDHHKSIFGFIRPNSVDFFEQFKSESHDPVVLYLFVSVILRHLVVLLRHLVSSKTCC